METRYVVEVTNHINKTVKNAYIDHKEGSIGYEARGCAALRKQSTIPVSVNKKELDYILKSLKNGFYRERSDGSRALPEVLTRFGGMVLPTRKVNITVRVFEVSSGASIQDVSVREIESFIIKGTEGKGKANRHETFYNVLTC